MPELNKLLFEQVRSIYPVFNYEKFSAPFGGGGRKITVPNGGGGFLVASVNTYEPDDEERIALLGVPVGRKVQAYEARAIGGNIDCFKGSIRGALMQTTAHTVQILGCRFTPNLAIEELSPIGDSYPAALRMTTSLLGFFLERIQQLE